MRFKKVPFRTIEPDNNADVIQDSSASKSEVTSGDIESQPDSPSLRKAGAISVLTKLKQLHTITASMDASALERLKYIKVEMDEQQNGSNFSSAIDEGSVPDSMTTIATSMVTNSAGLVSSRMLQAVSMTPNGERVTLNPEDGQFYIMQPVYAPLPQHPQAQVMQKAQLLQQGQLMQQTQMIQQGHIMQTSVSLPLNLPDIPILSDMEGDFGFSLSIEEKEPTNKSPMWLMSKVTKKLYTNINKAVPFEIHFRKRPKGLKLNVRATPVFSSPQFQRLPVKRCPNHAAATDATNYDFPFPEHVVRADDPRADYQNNNGRRSVIVPLDEMEGDHNTLLLRFMCLGSCVGGINRKQLAVVITIELKNQIIGRRVVHVRVCACPTRDIKSDEQAVANIRFKRKGESALESKVPVLKKRVKVEGSHSDNSDDSSEIHYIPVNGTDLANYLLEMKKLYLRMHPEYALRYPDIQEPRKFHISTHERTESDIKVDVEQEGWEIDSDVTNDGSEADLKEAGVYYQQDEVEQPSHRTLMEALAGASGSFDSEDNTVFDKKGDFVYSKQQPFTFIRVSPNGEPISDAKLLAAVSSDAGVHIKDKPYQSHIPVMPVSRYLAVPRLNKSYSYDNTVNTPLTKQLPMMRTKWDASPMINVKNYMIASNKEHKNTSLSFANNENKNRSKVKSNNFKQCSNITPITFSSSSDVLSMSGSLKQSENTSMESRSQPSSPELRAANILARLKDQ